MSNRSTKALQAVEAVLRNEHTMQDLLVLHMELYEREVTAHVHKQKLRKEVAQLVKKREQQERQEKAAENMRQKLIDSRGELTERQLKEREELLKRLRTPRKENAQ